MVVPAVSFAYLARGNGARILEYNLEQTFPDPDVGLYGSAEVTMIKTLAEVKKLFQ